MNGTPARVHYPEPLNLTTMTSRLTTITPTARMNPIRRSQLDIRRLEPQFYSKIWGSEHLEPWFRSRPGENIGEVWFPAGDLLIKFLFTSADLSVQVHPDENYARAHGERHGKTEMWHILRAEPGARIALGFSQPLSPEEVVAAAQTGDIMELLNWIEVHPGETYFVPAGMVHAIGAGLVLCEIQQHSDVTYRLYDYGRNRELHLQCAKEVVCPAGRPDMPRIHDGEEGIELVVDCPYFRTHVAVIRKPLALPLDARLCVVLDGEGKLNELAAYPGCVFENDVRSGWMADPGPPGSGFLKLLLIE